MSAGDEVCVQILPVLGGGRGAVGSEGGVQHRAKEGRRGKRRARQESARHHQTSSNHNNQDHRVSTPAHRNHLAQHNVTQSSSSSALNSQSQSSQSMMESSAVPGTSSTPLNMHPAEPPHKKARRRTRRNHHKRHHHIHRLAQPAPYNNNEFLMREHDPLSHLDEVHNADQEFSEEMAKLAYSSPEFEEEYLDRDFSNAYDVVHTERLNTMTKTELIQEYQALEERVESLERKLRSSSTSIREQEIGMDLTTNDDNCSHIDETREAVLPWTCNLCSQPVSQSQSFRSLNPAEVNSPNDEIKWYKEEVSRLRAENLKLRLRMDLPKIGNPDGSLPCDFDSNDMDKVTSADGDELTENHNNNGFHGASTSSSCSNSLDSDEGGTATPHLKVAQETNDEPELPNDSSDRCHSLFTDSAQRSSSVAKPNVTTSELPANIDSSESWASSSSRVPDVTTDASNSLTPGDNNVSSTSE